MSSDAGTLRTTTEGWVLSELLCSVEDSDETRYTIKNKTRNSV